LQTDKLARKRKEEESECGVGWGWGTKLMEEQLNIKGKY